MKTSQTQNEGDGVQPSCELAHCTPRTGFEFCSVPIHGRLPITSRSTCSSIVTHPGGGTNGEAANSTATSVADVNGDEASADAAAAADVEDEAAGDASGAPTTIGSNLITLPSAVANGAISAAGDAGGRAATLQPRQKSTRHFSMESSRSGATSVQQADWAPLSPARW